MAHVLVAEEEPMLRRMWALLLESEGHHVTAPTDFWGVIATLRATLHPLVVVYGRDGYIGSLAWQEERVAAFEASVEAMRRHRYVAMAWATDPLPPRLRVIEEQLEIEIVMQPMEVGDLFAAVNRAAARLAERTGA